MKRLLIFLFFISFYGNAQQVTTFSDQKLGRELCESFSMGFSSETEANDVLNKILSTIGASKRFVVQSCDNIPNAAAITIKGIRYIYYNTKFMNQINSNTNYWDNMLILAHEIGHHINGHTTDFILKSNNVVERSSLSESRKMELEADEFAGFVLAKLGASLTQATEVIALVSSDEDDSYSTHPSKSKRIAAITKGYNKAKVNVISYEKTSSSTAEEYFYSGYEKGRNGDWYGAISDYTKAIKINPDYAEPYNHSGLAKDRLNDHSGAFSDFSKAIELDPDYVSAYNNRGIVKGKLKDYSGAISDFTKAIELDPDYAYAYRNRGKAKDIIEDFYGAISDFTKAIELDPDDAAGYYWSRCLSKFYLGDKNGACQDARNAQKLGYKNATRFINNECN